MGQRPFLRVAVRTSISRELPELYNLTEFANRFCYTAKIYYETISQLDAAIADQSLSTARRADLIDEKSRLLRAFSERQARRELHRRPSLGID